MKSVFFILLLLAPLSVSAELITSKVTIRCPGKQSIEVDRAVLDKVGVMAGKGDFLPVINSIPDLIESNLYVVDGVAQRANYIAAIIWSSSLNKIGVACISEVNKIYAMYASKEPPAYYIEAMKKGLALK